MSIDFQLKLGPLENLMENHANKGFGGPRDPGGGRGAKTLAICRGCVDLFLE